MNWLSRPNSIKGATSILVVTLALSNFLGLIRDHFIAQKIPTDLLDTYYAAFRLPDLIFNTLILGAVSAAFIPIFSGLISQNKKDESDRLAGAIMTIGATVLILSVVLLFILMPYVVPWLVPKFSPEKQILTLKLSRLMLLSPLFFGISYFFSSILNSYKRFVVSSIAPLIYNLSIIAATMGFSDRYSVFALAWGVVGGAFLHMAIQLFPVKSLGVRLKLIWDTSSSAVRQVGRLMLPRSLGLGGLQILLISFTAIASSLGAGAVAILNLADNIQTMPTAVFGNSVASALFPTLAERSSLGDRHHFSRYLERAVISVLFFLVPASVAIILLRVQIIRLALGSGHFGWTQTVLTANTLGFFAVSIVFSGLVPLFARAFYALHDTRTPMYFSFTSVLISLILGLIFSSQMGITGLALAFSFGSLANCYLLYRGLRRKVAEFNLDPVSSALGKIVVATIIMAFVIQTVKMAVGTVYDLDHFLEVALQAGLAAVLGAFTYFAALFAVGFKQFELAGLERIIGVFIPLYRNGSAIEMENTKRNAPKPNGGNNGKAS